MLASYRAYGIRRISRRRIAIFFSFFSESFNNIIMRKTTSAAVPLCEHSHYTTIIQYNTQSADALLLSLLLLCVYTRTTISHRQFNGFIRYYYYILFFSILSFRSYIFCTAVAATVSVFNDRNKHTPSGTLMMATTRTVLVVIVSYRIGIKDAE